LILRKIINTVATGCHIVKLNCTKFDFGWGSAPDPLAGFKAGLVLREGRGGRTGVKGKGGEMERRTTPAFTSSCVLHRPVRDAIYRPVCAAQ